MSKQIYSWGKVKAGDIISFRYRGKSGNRLTTILVLNPKLFSFFSRKLIIPASTGVIEGNLISSLANWSSLIFGIFTLLKDRLWMF